MKNGGSILDHVFRQNKSSNNILSKVTIKKTFRGPFNNKEKTMRMPVI